MSLPRRACATNGVSERGGDDCQIGMRFSRVGAGNRASTGANASACLVRSRAERAALRRRGRRRLQKHVVTTRCVPPPGEGPTQREVEASPSPSSSAADAEPTDALGGAAPTAEDARLAAAEAAAYNRYAEEFGMTTRSDAGGLTSSEEDRTAVQKFLFPDKDELPDEVEMSIWEHLEELRERILVSVIGVGAIILGCFGYSKQLVQILESPVADKGVKFLQLSPGEFFFTSFKVAGYSGLLLGAPLILYEIIAFVLPGLTVSERKFLGPIVLGSSVLFYAGIFFSYAVLTPAALNFFVSYADGAVESLWSIDRYFEFVLVLMLSTGLSFQVPVIQLLLGQTGIVSSAQMFSVWRYVVVGAVVAAAVLTPSTDPFTQTLLAGPLIGLYLGGASLVRLAETSSDQQT